MVTDLSLNNSSNDILSLQLHVSTSLFLLISRDYISEYLCLNPLTLIAIVIFSRASILFHKIPCCSCNMETNPTSAYQDFSH